MNKKRPNMRPAFSHKHRARKHLRKAVASAKNGHADAAQRHIVRWFHYNDMWLRSYEDHMFVAEGLRFSGVVE